jgi:hypothetical protein
MKNISPKVAATLIENLPARTKTDLVNHLKKKRQEIEFQLEQINEQIEALDANKVEPKESKKPAKSSDIKDDRTHVEAIMQTLSKFPKGATNREIREALEKDGHPMKINLFSSTVNALVSKNRIGKEKIEDGKRDLRYFIPELNRVKKPQKQATKST